MGKSGTWKELFSFNESYKNKINITINIVNIRLYFIGLKKINLKCYLTLFYNTEMYALHGCSYTFILPWLSGAFSDGGDIGDF